VCSDIHFGQKFVIDPLTMQLVQGVSSSSDMNLQCVYVQWNPSPQPPHPDNPDYRRDPTNAFNTVIALVFLAVVSGFLAVMTRARRARIRNRSHGNIGNGSARGDYSSSSGYEHHSSVSTFSQLYSQVRSRLGWDTRRARVLQGSGRGVREQFSQPFDMEMDVMKTASQQAASL
jgi:hypothetical protein